MRCTCKTWTTWTATLWAAALLLCAAPGAAQGHPPPPAAADPAAEARFLALKATGDAARARGQITRATQAYLDALAIRKDPTVHGRLGMVAAKAGAHDAAAFHLLIALQRNGGTKAERAEFAAQFALVRPKVCLVHFEINVQGADLKVDGRRFLARGGYDFYFVSPGAHTAHASAPGYKDAFAHFEAPEGGETTVPLTLERPALPPGSAGGDKIAVERASQLRIRVPALVSGSYPQPGANPPREQQPFRAEVGLGAAVSPYGMPSVGVGGNAFVGLRWQRVTVAADIRGLITPASGIGDRQIPGRATLWTGSAVPCIIASFVDICGTLNLSIMTLDIDSMLALRSWDGFSTGIGIRAAARLPMSERFTAVFYGDASMELRTLVLRSAASSAPGGPREDWRSPQVRVTFGIAVAATVAP